MTYSAADQQEITDLRRLISQSTKIVAFTGAGISTDSGIPDFRGPDGIWTKNPEAEKLSTINQFLSSYDKRKGYWDQKLEGFGAGAKPNVAHYALEHIYERGKLTRVITQNIDGLHQAAGIPDIHVDELHGSMRHVECTECHRKVDTETFFAECETFGVHPADYECYNCKGFFKPGVVMFGEMLDGLVWSRAEKAAMGCGLMLVIGSSLQVYPAAGLVEIAVNMGATLVIINRDPTDFDRFAELVIRQPISHTMDAALFAGARDSFPEAPYGYNRPTECYTKEQLAEMAADLERHKTRYAALSNEGTETGGTEPPRSGS